MLTFFLLYFKRKELLMENNTEETQKPFNKLTLSDGRLFELSIDEQLMKIFDNLPKHLDLTELTREVTNITLGIFPSLSQFLKSYPPAQEVGESSNFLTTSQVLGICNDIMFCEALDETVVFTFLKTNNYQLTDLGNSGLCWIIKAKQ
jgi:hypothetical protein